MKKSVLHRVCAAGFILLLALFLSSCATTDTASKQEISEVKPPAAPAVPITPEQPKEQQEVTVITEQPLVTKDQQLRDAVNSFQLEKIYFDYDKYELKPEAREVLSKKAKWLKDNAGFALRIEGHCDERGTNEYNLALGERRAQAAFNYLVTLGVPATRISTISFGEERPFDPGHDEEAWAKNRRDEFVLSK